MLLDDLLGVLTLGRLSKGLSSHGALEGLEVESVSGREKVSVVDNLDERLDLGSLGNSLSTHGLGDLERVPVGVNGNQISLLRPESVTCTRQNGTQKSTTKRDTHFSIPATMAWG